MPPSASAFSSASTGAMTAHLSVFVLRNRGGISSAIPRVWPAEPVSRARTHARIASPCWSRAGIARRHRPVGPDRRRREVDCAELVLGRHPAELRVVRQAGGVVDHAERDPRLDEPACGARRSTAWRSTSATAPSVRSRLATRSSLVARAGSSARSGRVQHLPAQHPPLAVRLDRDEDHVAVGRDEPAVGGDRRVGQPDPGRSPVEVVVVQQRHGHPVGHRGEQRRLQVGPLPRPLPSEQRLGDGEGGRRARADVGHADPDPAGRPRCARTPTATRTRPGRAGRRPSGRRRGRRARTRTGRTRSGPGALAPQARRRRSRGDRWRRPPGSG